ncbi:dihydrodipicolinate synthase family protein [Natronosalvus halobius]|uniref:dihydrodipicolinate synthase family protein n=1 Tax=Natronosalvus halobius TaxID=2953746 RepID=UPI00209C795D|nr:dihydrodipicolinate synthase family protein [Natronosalvus halobius]USZ71654.1 dihydrodipicolinate synthase family protein [Natronosalvus halobius]
MHGTGVPLVTPIADDGRVDHERLEALVDWFASAGIDFFVPCGSTGEAPLLTADERTQVVETVAGATEKPVLAGTGHEGYEPTLEATEDAATAGADAALVVTPSYYGSDDAALGRYYRDLAEESPIPIYLYSVPKFTDYPLSPRLVESLATHENIAGIKDSSGSLESIQRLVRFTADADFSVLVGHGSVYAHALDAGADGGVLAVANAVPDLASEIFETHRNDDDAARDLNADIVELNRTLTARYGVPGIKAVLAYRGLEVGPPRRPLEPVNEDVADEITAVLQDALDA